MYVFFNHPSAICQLVYLVDDCGLALVATVVVEVVEGILGESGIFEQYLGSWQIGQVLVLSGPWSPLAAVFHGRKVPSSWHISLKIAGIGSLEEYRYDSGFVHSKKRNSFGPTRLLFGGTSRLLLILSRIVSTLHTVSTTQSPAVGI